MWTGSVRGKDPDRNCDVDTNCVHVSVKDQLKIHIEVELEYVTSRAATQRCSAKKSDGIWMTNRQRIQEGRARKRHGVGKNVCQARFNLNGHQVFPLSSQLG